MEEITKRMTIGLLQMDIAWADVAANIRTAEAAIVAAPDCDLYVLPEMWSTGFLTVPQEHEECFDGDAAMEWMKRTARERNVAVAGSMAVKDGFGEYYNRFYFVKPDGSSEHYDKYHLFGHGSGEMENYRQGSKSVGIEWRGVRFRLLVCYDLRFPIFSRNCADGMDGAYDVALYVASWPEMRIEAWRTLLRARAIENQCYVCGVNRIGTDPSCRYCGGTMAVDAYGRVQGACADNETGCVRCTVDLERLAAFRKKFPVLDDRDWQISI